MEDERPFPDPESLTSLRIWLDQRHVQAERAEPLIDRADRSLKLLSYISLAVLAVLVIMLIVNAMWRA